ncbi:hypothetical protein ATCC90586_011291 [Pythium insidiosum]|nr:hypothetical protein ATCC90586_011291 [Pythium insidiosum]
MTTTPSRFRNLRELETTKNAQLLIADDGESAATVLLKRMPLAGDGEHHHHANGASPSSTADADVFTGFDDPLQELAVADLLLHVGGHPSIVRCHEHFIKGDSLFLVTE